MKPTGTMVKTIFQDKLLMSINEACQEMDDATHNVQAWSVYVAYLLDCLEFHAMANDRSHPEQYELMLSDLKNQIAARLKNGSW
jgi:alpha-L-fucosidase